LKPLRPFPVISQKLLNNLILIPSFLRHFSVLMTSSDFNKLNDFDFYIGGENLLEYKQDNPILNYENPSSDSFDASLIWAPVNGRRIYFGLRYKLPI